MELYRWVKASERLPNYADTFICNLEYKDGNGTRSQWVEELKYSLGETFIRDEYLKGDVFEWLEPIEENEQDKLWDAIRVLAMEDEFREYNGQYCPEGFNVYKFIKKLSSKYYLLEKS